MFQLLKLLSELNNNEPVTNRQLSSILLILIHSIADPNKLEKALDQLLEFQKKGTEPKRNSYHCGKCQSITIFDEGMDMRCGACKVKIC